MPQPILDQSEGPKSASHSSDFKLRTPSIQIAEVLLLVHTILLGGGLFYFLQFFDQLTINTSLAWLRSDFMLILPLWLLYIIVPACYALTWRISSVRIDNSSKKSNTESNISIILIFFLSAMTIISLVVGLAYTVQCIYRIELFNLFVAINADLAFGIHSYYLYKTVSQDYKMNKLLKQEDLLTQETTRKTTNNPTPNQRIER